VLFALPMTTRKISLLFGVLHLQDEAVCEVLDHMDTVRKLRKRITDRLSQVRGKKREENRPAGWVLLDGIKVAEFKVLTRLSELDTADDSQGDDDDVRMTFTECIDLLESHGAKTSKEVVTEFFSRKMFEKFQMETTAAQATAQSAKTLRIDPNDGSGASDSVTVEEFAQLLLREVANAMNEAFEYGVLEHRLLKWERELTKLGIVTERGVEAARKLARTKLLFKAVDKDGSGSITKTELYTALRRYKVPITKPDFAHLLRVIDPDQSNSMSMEEWIDFMMATDDESDAQMAATIDSENLKNSEKGTGLTQLLGEGITLLAGNAVGSAFDIAIKAPLDATAAAVTGGDKSPNRQAAGTPASASASVPAEIKMDNPLAKPLSSE